jgi:hypothetical protein
MSNTVRAGAIIDINLLPRARRPAEVSPRAVAASFVLAIAIIALIPVSIRAAGVRDDASAMQQRAAGAESQVRSLQVDLARVRALRVQIDEATTQREAIEDELAALRGGTRPLGDDLARLWGPLPGQPGVGIKRIATAAAGLTVTGGAPGPLEAIAYAQALASDSGFPDARMVSFAPAAGGAGEFTIEVTR